MFGVHLEERVIVAVDPAMHNPTRFSRSIEFKTSNLEQVHRTGWHGWERERSWSRREVMPQESLQTEVLLGLAPAQMARYVLLERKATGVPPGQRLLMIERKQLIDDERHALEVELGLAGSDILDMIEEASRLHVAIRGRAAEIHLRRLLRAEPALEAVVEMDEDGQPDFRVAFRGRSLRIECKNTLRKRHQGRPKVDFQKTRAAKADPCSRYYRASQFEILAACLHPVTERWEFLFCPTAALPVHRQCKGHLSQHVLVGGGAWTTCVTDALGSVLAAHPD